MNVGLNEKIGPFAVTFVDCIAGVIVYTSGYTENAIVHNGKLDRGVELISRPYNPNELSLTLRQALDRPKKRNSSSDFGQTSDS